MPPGGHITSDSDLESVISLQVRGTRVKRHSGGDKYTCSVEGCEQSFTRLDHLDRHVYKHTGIKKHACHFEGCTKTYSILTHLKRHIRCTHERPNKEPNKTVPCEVDTCDKLFTSICNMKRHIREVHENPKVYKCQFCEEKFSQKLKMRRHEISKHTGIYPHNCEKCSKGFYQKWQWEKHEATCKVYTCLTCDKKFDKWTLFVKHCKDTQHARQYYKCEYCESAYVKPSDLQKHVAAKHITEAESQVAGEYKCQHEGCERSYVYERNLRQHVSIAHGGKTFDCTHEDCDKVFSSFQNLKKHIERDHTCDKPSTSSSKKTKKTLKRKKRKDAGIPKISNLAKLAGITVDKDLNKKLKRRDTAAMDSVAAQLSQEMDMDSSYSEQEIADRAKLKNVDEGVEMDTNHNGEKGSSNSINNLPNLKDKQEAMQEQGQTCVQQECSNPAEAAVIPIQTAVGNEQDGEMNLANPKRSGEEEACSNSAATVSDKVQIAPAILNDSEEGEKSISDKELCTAANVNENSQEEINLPPIEIAPDKELCTAANVNENGQEEINSPPIDIAPDKELCTTANVNENGQEEINSPSIETAPICRN